MSNDLPTSTILIAKETQHYKALRVLRLTVVSQSAGDIAVAVEDETEVGMF